MSNKAENIDAERAAPCPLCGSTQVQVCRDANNPAKDYCRCRECKCTGPLEVWNRRTPSASIGEDGLPPSWGPTWTVADMVRNLRTLDQTAPIYSAFHVDYQGERRCRTRPVWISRERVIDGKWIEATRKDVPYAMVVWAKPDERATDDESQQAAQGVKADGDPDDGARAWMMSHGYGNQSYGYALADLQSRIDAKDAELRQLCAQIARQSQDIEVGTVVGMPGSGGGFTMCAFNASDVPIGTKLYAAPPLSSEQQSSKSSKKLSNLDNSVRPLPLSGEQRAKPVCRNCLDFGWEPSVSGERRSCGFCQKPAGEQKAEKGEQ